VSRAPLLLLLALALLLAGCGDSPKEPPRAGVGTSLDADNLAHVHDELYACLRAELPDVLLANYLGGQASITNRLARSTFDERLAVPGAERELLDAGRAEFIGVRANRSLPRWRAVPEWDLLILPTTGRYFHVPYRSLLPKGVRHLIVAGRCIGGDKVSHAAVRNMMCCTVSGQGAGVAAAVSFQTGRAFDDLDLGLVRSELQRQGVRVA